MSESLKLDLDNDALVKSTKESIVQLDKLLAAVEKMSSRGAKAQGEFAVEVKEKSQQIKTSFEVLQDEMNKLTRSLEGKGRTQLKVVEGFTQDAKQRYQEYFLALEKLGKKADADELIRLQEQGAQLTRGHAKIAADRLNLTRAWLKAKDAAEAEAIVREQGREAESLQNALKFLQERNAAEEAVRGMAQAKSLEAGQQLLRGQQVIAAESLAIQKREAAMALAIEEKKQAEILAAKRNYSAKEQMYTQLWVGMENKERKEAAREALAIEEKRQAEMLAAKRSYAAKEQMYTKLWVGMEAQERIKALRDTETALKKTGPAADSLSNSFKKLAIDGNDLHSVSRGLASGFNLLWLTWGNLAPLFAGAAISFGVKSIIELGAKAQNTFETIRVLSEETVGSVQSLNKQMLELGRTGPFGPLQIAEAMKTLSLAGLNASQVSVAIKDVLNFAVAGTTSISQAADVMTSVGAAFNITAEGYNYIGDVISKTAAVSKSSVESIGEAFKTASVINKQYGVSLEDVGVGLAALSNLGIQGSAAGTALRNMYVDLSGRTPKVAKLLKEFNLELRDSNGRMKDIITITKEVNGVLDNMQTNIDKKNFLRDALSERGAKPIIELMDLARQQAKDMGDTVDSRLEALRQSIMDSAGFMIKASAQMALTPLNQMQSVLATLQSSLVEAFQGLEPVVLSVAQSLKAVFNSEEFKTGLQNLMTGVAYLTKLFVEHLDIVGKLAIAYVAWKAAQVTGSIFGAVALGVTALSTAMTGATVATTAATVASKGFMAGASRLLAFLGPIGAAIAAVVTAWQLYDIFATKSTKTMADNANSSYSEMYIAKLKEETLRLNENTEAMQQNISVQELRDSKQTKDLQKKIASSNDSKVLEAQREVDKAQADLRTVQDAASKSQYKSYAPERQAAVVAAAQTKLKAAQAEATQRAEIAAKDRMYAEVEVHVAAERNKYETLKKAEASRKGAEDQLGSRHYGGMDDGEAAKAAAAAAKLAREQAKASNETLQATEKAETEREKVLKHSYDTEASILEAKHRNDLISEGEYQAKALANILRYEDEAAQIRADSNLTMLAEVQRRAAEIDKSLSGQGRIDAYAELYDRYQAYLDKVDAADQAQQDNAQKRLQNAISNSAGELKKLQVASTKFWTEDAIAQEAAINKVTMAVNEYSVAANTAGTTATAKYATYINGLTLAAAEAEVALREMGIALEGSTSPEATRMLEAAQSKLDGIRKLIKDSQDKAQVGITQARVTAIENVAKGNIAKLVGGMSDAIETAIFDGGEAGAAKMRQVMQEELLRKPFRVLLQGVMSDLTGGLFGGKSGGSSTAEAIDGIKSMYGMLGGSLKGALGGSISWLGNLFGSEAVSSFGASLSGTAAAAAEAASAAAAQTAGTTAGTAAGTGGAAAGGASSGIAAVPIIGWIIAGMMASGAMYDSGHKWNGKYTVLDPAQEAMAGVGKEIGIDDKTMAILTGSALIQGLGDLIGGWFGGGSERTTATRVSGSFSGSGFSGSTAQDWYNPGSWWGHSSSGTNTRQVDGSVAGQLGTAFVALKNQSMAFGKMLGLSTAALDNFSYSFTKSTDGMSPGAAIQQAMEEMISVMAGRLISTTFQRSGEALSATLQRLATDLTVVNSVFDVLGKAILPLSELSGGSASNLVAAFGGLEKFNEATTSYYDNFFTDAEKRANTVKALTGMFAQMGMTLPTTNQAFRDLVNAQDITTEAGQRTFVALMNMSSAFSTLTETSQAATKALTETSFATKVAYERFMGRVINGSIPADTQRVDPYTGLPAFASGGQHTGGWRVVGEHGPELENTGPSAVYNNAQSLFDSGPIVAELRSLRADVNNLREEARATAVNTGKMARIEDKWDTDGLPLERT